MQSEFVEAATPTSADAWTDVGTFTVPIGAQSIKRVVVSEALDPAITAGTAASVRGAPVFRIRGSGLLEQDPHEFLGMHGGFATVGGTNTNAFTMTTGVHTVEHEVDIPVSSGGTITAQVNLLDEAGWAGNSAVGLIYSSEAAAATNSMSQQVNVAGTTTADAFATVDTITIPKPEKPPTRIVQVDIGIAPDFGTSTADIHVQPYIRLSGAGIAEGGRHDFIGPSGLYNHTAEAGTGVAGAGNIITLYKSYMVDIPVNAGGQILVEHQYADETPAGSTVTVGVKYR